MPDSLLDGSTIEVNSTQCPFNDDLRAQLSETQNRLRQQVHQSLLAFAQLAEMRLEHKVGGNLTSARIARAVAKKMELSQKQISEVYYAGLLHNIGLIGLPDPLLKKPYVKMNKEERRSYDSAHLATESIMLSIPGLGDSPLIIHQLYERYDGMGFPDGFFGDQINIGSRILTPVIDYGSLQNGTFYGEHLSSAEAIERLRQDSGKRYDPEVMKTVLLVLLSLAEDETKATYLELDSGRVKDGMVLAKDLYSPDKLLLLRQGQRLTDKIIASVRNLEQHSGERMSFHVQSQQS